MVNSKVKIRVPKSTSKPPKLTPSQIKLQAHCTCEDDESVCSETCGLPGGESGGDNLLNFQLNSELVYSKKEHHDRMCTLCNVTPSNAPKGVQAQKVLHPDKDVFIQCEEEDIPCCMHGRVCRSPCVPPKKKSTKKPKCCLSH
ncbi:Pre-mRNA-splicing factor ISY1-like protein [Operophtera brumata]|uniref:Pre-mRNA-splicing factor ISY1-like protein n=1 Tax=Operophtera brumata TaxID=104452 RepID=A0A0L7LDF9_OPEBR|nr:Pre-mRNA-splicing factor ISY1-like protein [Operophtera brumata]